MIRHVSIPAMNPANVAKVLAELMHGRAYKFPGDVRDAFMAVSGDPAGTMIEVYPLTAAGRPGEDEAPGRQEPNPNPPEFWPFHLLMSVPLRETDILAVGAREGWRTKRFGRGAPGARPLFEVIEMWVENRFLVELAPEDMISPYERTYQFELLDRAGVPSV